MNWILGLLSVLIIIFLATNFSRKKRLKRLKERLIDQWGRKSEETHYHFFSIARYFENNRHKKSAYHIVSNKTSLDLDLDEVFKFIDRTTSKVGQQYLYFKLRTIGTVDRLKEFSSLVNLFKKESELRLRCQVYLSRLNSNDAYALEELINGQQIQKPKIYWLLQSLTVAAIIAIIMAFFYPVFILLLIPILAVNSFFHYRNKDNVNYYVSGVKQLSIALSVSKRLSGIDELSSFFKDFSFVKKIDAIRLKTEFIAFEKKLDNEFAAISWFLIELVKIQFNIEYIIFFSFIDAVNREKDSIDAMFRFIGEVDSAISIASVQSGQEIICHPKFSKGKEIIVKEISHPLIVNCVPNDFQLIDQSLLLTGSNMSGKTTFIRTVAINSILAQTFYMCFAKEFKAPFFKVFSSIRIADDITENTSYYLEEVVSIKEAVDASNEKEPYLFILDEIFKGTNTIERVSGGKAILSYLSKGPHVVLVSTHDIELTDLLTEKEYQLFHFTEQIDKEELRFDHKLKKGKLKTRNAIRILEMYDYPKEIIMDAKDVKYSKFESESIQE
ncbi:MutS-related protein [Lutimonas sp.]|uniref:MutS-related protein n=1 Tax=Lutimonas sp. TaxID=1872403 RepID=UPI003D9B4CEC